MSFSCTPVVSQCICLLKLCVHPLQWGCIEQLFLVGRKSTVIELNNVPSTNAQRLWGWMEEWAGLDSAMPQLYKLFSLVAKIGATSAGVERSFSCLKRLKSYTCNTMGQGRLSSPALLAIERTLIKSLEKTTSWYDRVTEHFLEKERRAEFTYK